MKAEEKAQEIYDKFLDLDNLEVRCSQFCSGGSVEKKPLAKECALIAVDEIIESHNYIGTPKGNSDYWQEVKQHLLTLNQ